MKSIAQRQDTKMVHMYLQKNMGDVKQTEKQKNKGWKNMMNYFDRKREKQNSI